MILTDRYKVDGIAAATEAVCFESLGMTVLSFQLEGVLTDWSHLATFSVSDEGSSSAGEDKCAAAIDISSSQGRRAGL